MLIAVTKLERRGVLLGKLNKERLKLRIRGGRSGLAAGATEAGGFPRSATVLIAGGFLGQAIATGLQRRYRVVGLDVRQPKRACGGHMETIEIDLTTYEVVDRAVSRQRASRKGARPRSFIAPPTKAICGSR